MSFKKSVLVLNNSYEPLQTISIKDAFTNYFNGKYYIEEYDDEVYHSQKSEWRVPSVVRLKEYKTVSQRRRHSASKRSRIYIRDKFKCGYCGTKQKEKELTLDHILPKAKGGKNDPDNLVTCCFKCNQIKKDKLLSEVNMKLIHPPKHLEIGLDKVVMHHYANVRPNWAKYLYLANDADGDSKYSIIE